MLVIYIISQNDYKGAGFEGAIGLLFVSHKKIEITKIEDANER